MSQTTPAQAVVSGTAFSIAPPSSSPFASVVVTNLSPYLLLLNVQANALWQAPFSEVRYQIGATAQPIQVLPSTPAGATIPAGIGAQVQATWYAPGELVIGTWPYSLTSSVQAATVLGNVAVTNFPATQPVSGTVAVSAVAGTVTVAGTVAVSAVAGTVTVTDVVAAAPGTGQTNVAAGPTAAQLGNIACARGLRIRAKSTNTNPVYVGNSAVTTSNGLELNKTDAPVTLPVDNANRLWVIGTAGEGVSYLGL